MRLFLERVPPLLSTHVEFFCELRFFLLRLLLLLTSPLSFSEPPLLPSPFSSCFSTAARRNTSSSSQRQAAQKKNAVCSGCHPRLRRRRRSSRGRRWPPLGRECRARDSPLRSRLCRFGRARDLWDGRRVHVSGRADVIVARKRRDPRESFFEICSPWLASSTKTTPCRCHCRHLSLSHASLLSF